MIYYRRCPRFAQFDAPLISSGKCLQAVKIRGVKTFLGIEVIANYCGGANRPRSGKVNVETLVGNF